MCGIAGIFMRDGQAIPGQEIIRDMTDVLSHRGPDDSGFYVDGPVALGHRRLSIIDLGTGHQPMFNEDRSMAIVFNGEVYNFEELRADLESRGHRFRTRSDTETILHAYEEWGEESPSKFRGMFAYAIWDGARRRLFLARDRIGKKPIYFVDTPKVFLFGSEIKALLAHPEWPREIDPEALSDYLTYLYVPAPKSIFRSVRKLPPAHSLTVDMAGSRLREYWDLRFRSEEGRSEAAWTEELAGRIQESVRIRLKSEVPLGAFLSGGLDSSVVVGSMARLMDRPVETMSIGFEEEEFNEIPFAREVASRFATRHHEYTVGTDAAGMIGTLARIYDEPFADSSSLPTFHVSRIARKNVTVALSGDGGDENFGGYRRYVFDVLEQRLRHLLPPSLRKPLFGGIARFYPKGDWLPRPLRAKTLLSNLAIGPEEGYFRTMSAFLPEAKETLLRPEWAERLAGYDAFSVFESHFSRAGTTDPLARIQYVDIKTYLPDDILVKVDRASMANGLEVRAPLLDHELMEFVATMPSRLKLRGRTGKHILKQVALGFLPPPLVHRKKMGFSVPLDAWFRSLLRPVAMDLLLTPTSRIGKYFRPDTVRRLWDEHQSGWRNHGTGVWVLLTLESWHRRYLG